MTKTTSIIIPDASAIQVDTSCIDVSEVESKEDQAFLMEKGGNILRIVAKAALEVGQQLVEIQDRFRSGEKTFPLLKFYESLQLSQNQANQWANKYRAFRSYIEIFGAEGAAEKFNGLGDLAVSKLWQLPTDYREALLADIALGDYPTTEKVTEISKRPEVKLSKAEELLAAARVRAEKGAKHWEMVKADPEISWDTAEYKASDLEYRTSMQRVNKYEQRIAELQRQMEEAEQKASAEAAAREKAEATIIDLKDELRQYDEDDQSIREARMRRVENALLATLPSVQADLQRFYTEIEHYDPDTVMFLEEHIKILKNFVESHL